MKNAKSLNRLGKDLHWSIHNKNVKKIRSIFSKYPGLLTSHKKSVDVVKMVLLEATSCSDEGVLKELMKVLKSGGTKNYLDLHLYFALSKGNVKLAELLLKNGASMKEGKAFSQMGVYEKTSTKKMLKIEKEWWNC